MARHLPPSDPVGEIRAPASAADPAADALAVQNPDITLVVAGQSVTVREYTFWQAQDVVYRDRAFLDDCIALLSDNAVDLWVGVRGMAGRHAAYLQSAIAVATGRDVAWVQQLSPRDTDSVFTTWWSVNGHFFVGEATVVVLDRLARKVRKSAGTPSSLSSASPLDVITASSGMSTPNAN